MQTLLIVNVGPAPEKQLSKFGNFELWAKQAIGDTPLTITFHDGVHQPLPDRASLAGVIIMGSLSMVTEETDWMKRLAGELVELHRQKVPLLGICFGHQLLAWAFGGEAGFNPNGLEVGTVDITRTAESADDPLLSALPERFQAQTIHFQSALTLPDKAVVLAQSEQDKHHAFRLGHCTWGVQFHPEFSAEIMLDMLDNVAEHLGGEVLEQKKQQVVATENARQVLVGFARLCAGEVD
jgi:GMP synthase (glutamine-hydrolysing)